MAVVQDEGPLPADSDLAVAAEGAALRQRHPLEENLERQRKRRDVNVA